MGVRGVLFDIDGTLVDTNYLHTIAWRRHFDALKPEIRALPGAADLLRAVAARGLSVTLASSSEPDDVEALLGALGCDEVIKVVTSAGDVDDAKPSPEVFEAALAKAELSAAEAIVVGDTVWDIEAARRAGLDCICVLTGGTCRAELLAAGAMQVYSGAASLLAHLADTPLGRP